MDMIEKDKYEGENRNEDPINCHAPSISSDWRYGGANLTNSSMDMIPTGNPVVVCKGDVMGASSCSAASMVDTFESTLWNHPANSQMEFCDIDVQNSASTSNSQGMRKGSAGCPRSGIDRIPDMSWNPPSSMLKGGIFLPTTSGLLAHILSQVPADSAFIERAARFSCFSGNSFSDMVNPFTIPESMVHYPRGEGMMQGGNEIFIGTSLNSVSGGQSQKNELKVGKTCKDVSMPVGHGSTDGSPLKNEKSEDKEGIGGSGNESDEAEFSGGGGQDDLSMSDGTYVKASRKGFGLKKRKRVGQDADNDQAKKAPEQPGEVENDTKETQQKEDQNPTLATNNASAKHDKQGSNMSDPVKEDYIHIRARRGQATNSHSLAERVRREKISERMKFLQDLVPSCNKVTGKAVMLDEIINYVQSLQRQVEFLSMKLATVNPQLDFNSEGLLAKDILKSRAGPSSTMGFPSDMPMGYHQMLVSQPGLVQAGLTGMGTSSDVLRRTMNPQMTPMTGSFKDHTQIHTVWDDELQNVYQMNFETHAPQNSQDVDESLPPSHMKIEL